MIQQIISLFVPNPAGAIWIGLLVMFFIFGDFKRFFSRSNLSLAALLLAVPFLVDILRLGYQSNTKIGAWVFTGLFLVTIFYAVWGFLLARKAFSVQWKPNLTHSGLLILVLLILFLDVIIVFGRIPDDCGYYTNLGARRWAETGGLPYGDSKLKGPDSPGYGASATYGPLLYASHLPFQWLLRVHSNPSDADPEDLSYRLPPNVTTQLTCLAFFLVGLAALFFLVREFSGNAIGLGVVALYASSPYIIGLGGSENLIGGLAYISHIAPSSVMLLALAFHKKPFLSGVLLASSVGLLFYPVFVFPAWFGWRIWRKDRPWRFAAGFLIAGLVIMMIILLFTHSPENQSAISLFLDSTLEHQEGVGMQEYGGSRFGFWGTHPTLASFWQKPLFGEISLLKPTFILYALLCLGAFFYARGLSLAKFAGLTAGLTAAVQLWKTHAGGTYVEWFLPFLMIAIFCSGTNEQTKNV